MWLLKQKLWGKLPPKSSHLFIGFSPLLETIHFWGCSPYFWKHPCFFSFASKDLHLKGGETMEGGYLEDHPMTCKWLTMVIVSPLRIGLWDQMSFLWLIHGGYQPLTNWDDPPSSLRNMKTCLFTIFCSKLSDWNFKKRREKELPKDR